MAYAGSRVAPGRFEVDRRQRAGRMRLYQVTHRAQDGGGLRRNQRAGPALSFELSTSIRNPASEAASRFSLAFITSASVKRARIACNRVKSHNRRR